MRGRAAPAADDVHGALDDDERANDPKWNGKKMKKTYTKKWFIA